MIYLQPWFNLPYQYHFFLICDIDTFVYQDCCSHSAILPSCSQENLVKD